MNSYNVINDFAAASPPAMTLLGRANKHESKSDVSELFKLVEIYGGRGQIQRARS